MFGIKAKPRDPHESAALNPVFQIHPTRRCNLRCLHCYSESGPEHRDALTVAELTDALTDARAQGYLTASFSGGEPLLFSGLGTLLRHAKSLGMRTAVTSNGMLLTEARLTELAPHIDALAISLDGIPESHDRMRNYAGAFNRMAENLPAVRASGIHFGFIFTLTKHNVDEAEWAAEFAVNQGATLFQIHPLEEVGRALETLPGARPDAQECARLFPEAERIRKVWGKKLFVQLDTFHRDLLIRHPERFQAGADPVNLAACVNPLVLEADGTLVPVGYGFPREYAMGNIRERRLRDAAPVWLAEGSAAFQDLCRRVYDEACQPARPVFFNWYEMLQTRAAKHFRAIDPVRNKPYAEFSTSWS